MTSEVTSATQTRPDYTRKILYGAGAAVVTAVAVKALSSRVPPLTMNQPFFVAANIVSFGVGVASGLVIACGWSALGITAHC